MLIGGRLIVSLHNRDAAHPADHLDMEIRAAAGLSPTGVHNGSIFDSRLMDPAD